jgi:hypothetical protein
VTALDAPGEKGRGRERKEGIGIERRNRRVSV